MHFSVGTSGYFAMNLPTYNVATARPCWHGHEARDGRGVRTLVSKYNSMSQAYHLGPRPSRTPTKSDSTITSSDKLESDPVTFLTDDFILIVIFIGLFKISVSTELIKRTIIVDASGLGLFVF